MMESNPWTSHCALGNLKSLHIHEDGDMVAIVDWGVNTCYVRPRILTVDLAIQKCIMLRRAMVGHARFLCKRVPSCLVCLISEFYIGQS